MPTRLFSLLKSNTLWLEKQQSSILSAALVITVANGISSLSGLLRQRLLIAYFFDTPASQQAYEAFLVAFQIPDMIFQLIIIGALSAAFIPIFSTYSKRDPQRAFVMSSIMMNVLLLTFLVVGLVVVVFAHPLTAWRTGHQFTADQIRVAAQLTQIMILAQFFFAVSNFMTGILQSFQRFIIPSLAPIFYNVGILVGVYLLSDRFGIYAAGMGVVLGAFLHMAIQVPLVLKLGFRYHLSLNLKFEGIREFFTLMPPRVITLSVGELRKLALGFFATSLGNLSFLVMQLGLTLMALPIRFFGVPISQASLPFLSDEAQDQDRQRFRHLVVQSLNQIVFLTLPTSVLLLILRQPVVRLVYGTANFPWEATRQTWTVVAIISVSIAAQALAQMLVRAFYAVKDTKTPLVVTMVDISLYVILSAIFVFVTPWGVLGIAVATTLSAFIEYFMLLFLLDRKLGRIVTSQLWVPHLKIVLASFLMAVFLYLPYKIFDELVFDTRRTVELIGLTITTSTIGLLVYIFFAALLDIRELRILRDLLAKFGPWKSALQKSSEVVIEVQTDGGDL